MKLDRFINRPVLSTVISILIVILGLIGLATLPITQYPDIAPPTVSVRATYQGANAQTVLNSVIAPLEDQINGVENMMYMTSSASNNGSAEISIYFKQGTDPDMAAVNVQNRVSMAQGLLPAEVTKIGVTTRKRQTSMLMVFSIYDEKDQYNIEFLENYANINLIPEVKRVNGVGDAMVLGQDYSMRIWLKPDVMAQYKLIPNDVVAALSEQNIEAAPGQLGERGNQTYQYTLRYKGRLQQTTEFENIVIKALENGEILRLKDVASVELGRLSYGFNNMVNGHKAVSCIIFQMAGSNATQTISDIEALLDDYSSKLPAGLKINIAQSANDFLFASIHNVVETLVIAIILVILVVYFFLQDFKSTLIPSISIIVSLVGTFACLVAAGFSLNILTLFALVLAIGTVVDDAIVMTENIYIRIEKGMKPFDAGIEGAKEIFFAVISTTITLVAVFLPIVFMEGTSGRLFREFSFVVAGSVIISSFAALTFTPMLATKLLIKREKQGWFYRKTEPFFEGMNRIYGRSLDKFLSKRVIAIPFTLITLVLIAFLWNKIPAEMAPLEDRSKITISTRAAEGASYEYIRDYTEDINDLVDSIVPDAAAVTARVSSGSGNIQITLKDIQDRDYTQMQVAEKISKAIRTKTKARAFVQQQSSFGGRRSSMPVQYVLQAVSIDKLEKVLPEFLNRVYDNPTFQMADVDLKFSSPEMRVNINRDKAGSMGVNVRDIAETLQYGLSGQRMGYFYMNGKQYEILGQINRQQRNQPANIKSIYIRNDKGQMIQMDNLVEFVEAIAPPKLYHYNRFISATISAGLAEGKTIGEGLDEMDKIASEVLDETFRTALSGDSKDYRESSSSLMFAFILALVLIYLILAAQFESFKDPFIIMLTVPLAIAGALVFMFFGDITMNIFSQIGIIMLIGLVAKNGILIVEFANQKQEAGENKMQAIRDAALQRLRPILMTSASTILGLLPLTFATGEGANQRIAMGTAVVGGMLVSTFLTMYIVPAIYSYISTNREKKENKV